MASMKVKTLYIDGMSCINCERKIENKLSKLKGVIDVDVSYNRGTAQISYDEEIIELEEIENMIEKLDYFVRKTKAVEKRSKQKVSDVNQILGIGLILFALYILVKNTMGFNFIPEIKQSMGYGILFVVGILTSLHCVAMCGGINISQCASYKVNDGSSAGKLMPSFLYNSGRVISYTIIGGIIGALGSVISFSNSGKSIIMLISGGFMIIMGLNMLNIFPWLRKLNPRMPKIFANKINSGINEGKKNKRPFIVGLLNGLMPCGPLQAMQLYALGTGSFAAGAFSMFMFSLGTVPLMFGLGALSSFLSGKFTHKMMKVSATLVLVLGFVMINRGLKLSGVSPVFAVNSKKALSQNAGNVASVNGDIQVIKAKLGASGEYPNIVVQEGKKVRFILQADSGSLNGCNRTVVIPEFNIQKELKEGQNVIEFTPKKEGNIVYTCWMGMVSGNITVVPDIKNTSASTVNKLQQTSPSRSSYGGGGMSCCGF